MGEQGESIVAALEGLGTSEALELLRDWRPPIDWATLPGGFRALTDGGRLRFDKRRREVAIERPDGGLSTIDLGRRDRLRPREAILTPDLVRIDGPELEVALTPAWSDDQGDLAVRDPLDRKGKRAATTVPVGTYRASRYVDGSGRPALVAVAAFDGVAELGTFLMDGGLGYAHLRAASGLAGFSDAGRVTFMKAVTDELVEQARIEGFAQVVTKAGPIGVIVDCGAPGDYLALAPYDAVTHATVGIVVDLRRPPVEDGAIVDPDPS